MNKRAYKGGAALYLFDYISTSCIAVGLEQQTMEG